MKVECEKTYKKMGLYSIDKYQGSKKWCFAIVLNKATTNLDENPNLFEKTLTKYEQIRKKDWFDEETFRGLARLRGMECRAHYAEAFWSRKLLLR